MAAPCGHAHLLRDRGGADRPGRSCPCPARHARLARDLPVPDARGRRRPLLGDRLQLARLRIDDARRACRRESRRGVVRLAARWSAHPGRRPPRFPLSVGRRRAVPRRLAAASRTSASRGGSARTAPARGARVVPRARPGAAVRTRAVPRVAEPGEHASRPVVRRPGTFTAERSTAVAAARAGAERSRDRRSGRRREMSVTDVDVQRVEPQHLLPLERIVGRTDSFADTRGDRDALVLGGRIVLVWMPAFALVATAKPPLAAVATASVVTALWLVTLRA